jgi:YVTN family beta-propeller protein
VTPINLATNKPGAEIKVGSVPQRVAITPDGKTAYVTNDLFNSVTPINLATNTPGTEIKVGAGPIGIGITPDGKTAYVCNGGANSVTPIEVATNKPGTEIKVGETPKSCVVSPDGKTVYVVNKAGNSVTPIEVATNKPGAEIKVGSEPDDVVFTPNGKTAYVTNSASNSVTPIEVATNKPGAEIKVGSEPFGLAVTPDGKTVYVNNFNSDSVTPIEVATNKPGTEIKVGGGPQRIAITANVPTVTNVKPASGPTAGGTPVTITGANFTEVSAVKFGASNATSFKVLSATSIEAVSPAGAGTVDVTVTTTGGTSATGAGDHFTYVVAPTVVTGAATSVHAAGAVLNGTVNPNGGNVSECKFEYGTTVSYGSSAPCSPSPGAGESVVAVSASLSGLSPSTTYHYRIVATNAGGTTPGADGEFKTLFARHWYRGGAKLTGGLNAPIVAWGGTTNVAISSTATGEFVCKAVAGGVVENPLSGNAGTGEIQALQMYECKAPACEAAVKEKFGVQGRGLVGLENLPWHGELFEGGSPVFERLKLGEPFSLPFGSPKAGEMRVKTVCEVAPTKAVFSTSVFEGEVQPEIGEAASENLNGISALHPSVMKFTGATSGSLNSEGGEGTITGSLKYLGYTAQEVLGVKE